MENVNEMSMIIAFLKRNDYIETPENDSEYINFTKDGVSSIDISTDEIILVGEQGDWLHLPYSLYALIGALVHHRELACNYRQ